MKGMNWDRLKNSSPEEIVKGVAGKDDPQEKPEAKPPKQDAGSACKCPSCGCALTVQAAEQEAEGEAE